MNNDQRQPVYDAIISGAGPVGLFLACELALAKCSVLILEEAEDAHSPLKRIPFGIRGLSAPTIEALYRRGLLKELEVPKRLQNPHSSIAQGARRQAGHFAGIPFYDDNIDASQWRYRLPGSTDTSLVSEMEELETVLARRAETLGVLIKRGLAIGDFRQTANGVTGYAPMGLSPGLLTANPMNNQSGKRLLFGLLDSPERPRLRAAGRGSGRFHLGPREPQAEGVTFRGRCLLERCLA